MVIASTATSGTSRTAATAANLHATVVCGAVGSTKRARSGLCVLDCNATSNHVLGARARHREIEHAGEIHVLREDAAVYGGF